MCSETLILILTFITNTNVEANVVWSKHPLSTMYHRGQCANPHAYYSNNC